MRIPWRKPDEPVFTCEVCKGPDVIRRGIWDYCPVGHTYVGERADHE